MNVPSDLKYTKDDEWIKFEAGQATIGITDYAQDQLSDIVYLEVSLDADAEAEKGALFGTVESVKAAADLYLPVSGKLVAKNEGLSEAPETINSDPYEAGWIAKISLTNEEELDELMDAAAYTKYLEERDA